MSQSIHHDLPLNKRCIVITMLGRVDDYKKSKHYDQEGNKVCETEFAAEYLVHKYKPSLMFLMYLEFEKEITWDVATQLIQRLDSSKVPYKEMALSVQKSVAAPNNYDWDALLWEILSKINRDISEFSPDDHVIIDITHGFRTMPYMLMGVFRYLAIVKGIKHITIIYGNKIDAGDVGDTLPHVYFAEVSAFEDLNRWIDAATAFVRYGVSKDLCQEIKNLRVEKMSKRLEVLSNKLRKVTQTLHLVQWIEYVNSFRELQESIDRVLDADNFNDLPAFVVYVVEWLRNELAPMFRYDDNQNLEHHVQLQQQVLRWYRSNEMYTHALLLARELLLTKALIAGVECEKHEGTWSSGSSFKSTKHLNTEIVKLTELGVDGDTGATLKNDHIRQSNSSRYVRLHNDYNHAYRYELKPDKLYPIKFQSIYLKADKEFGQLVFDMRNDVGHGMGNSTYMNPALILEVLNAIIDDQKCAQPVIPVLP
jgi:CRISPR-associated DxTHG motif protein